jgi:hypothetical protein
MRDFQFYVTDDRYTVASLYLLSIRDEDSARRIAERILVDPHHIAVDVWERDTKLFSIGEDALKQTRRVQVA